MNEHFKKELDLYGYTNLGKMLSDDQVEFFRDNLIENKDRHIEKHGKDKLNKYNELEFLRNVGSFHEKYLELLESHWFNSLVNSTLNSKAILHGYHGILTNPESRDDLKQRFSPMRWHRDAPWFKETRTCVLILMPLVDFVEEVGPTEVCPTSHLFEDMPNQDFLEKHTEKFIGKAGTVFAMDGALYHRAGRNVSGKIRPMLQMNVTLAFMKQQINVWNDDLFANCSDLVKSRLGYNVRDYDDPDDMFTDDRNWKSGNYDTRNITIR